MKINFNGSSSIQQEGLVSKILLVMKLTLPLLLLFCIQVSAHVEAQSITYSKNNVSLSKVFNVIRDQTGYEFLYNSTMLKNNPKADVYFHKTPLKSALNKVFKNQPLTYAIVGETIVVKKRSTPSLLSAEDMKPFPQHEVSGTVVDSASGEPLAGVSIKVKGSQIGTSTDNNGSFSLTIPENAVIQVRYLGYKPKEIKVGNKSTLSIILSSISTGLSQIVVTGYRTINKKLFNGSSSTLKASDIERPGMSNISQMLEGEFAGVSMQNVSGTFGAAPKLRIRGASSLSGDNKPLWVIDGVIQEDVVNISNEALSTGDMNTLLGSSVAGIDPEDIEDITILRDAAATALYGARAMNGVVVVTTKKGRNTEGKARINYQLNLTRYIKPSYADFDVLNSADQMSVMMELVNKGYYQMPGIINGSDGGVFYKMYKEIGTYDPVTKTYQLRNDKASMNEFLSRYANANTNWFDIIFKNSLKQKHSLSITSGTKNFSTYASLSFLNDAGQTIGNKVQRYTGNVKVDFNLGSKFTGEIKTTGSVRNQRAPGTQDQQSEPVYGTYLRGFDINPYNYAVNTSRMITAYDENGDLEYFRKNYAPFNIINELNTNYMKLNNIDFSVQGKFGYQIIPELKYSILGSYRYVKAETQTYILENSNMVQAYQAAENPTTIGSNEYLYDNPDDAYGYPMVVLPSGGFYNVNMNNLKSYYIRHELNYNQTFNDVHTVTAYAAMEARNSDRQYEFFNGVGYQFENGGLVNPYYMYFKEAGEEGKPYFGMSPGTDRFLAYMIQATYGYDNKYILTPSLRYDGSNKMGKSKTARWLPTWNIAGKWNVFRENFWPKNHIVTSALVRASYGITGNIGSATNSAAVFYNQISRRPYLNDQETLTYISSLENSQLTWEKSKDLDIGLELGFMRNRFYLMFDYYNRDIYDLIGTIKTSGIGGQYEKTGNYATLHGRGMELTLSGRVIDTRDFVWNARFNVAHNKNKITRLDVDPSIWRAVSPNGAPVKEYPQRGLFAVEFAGLDHYFGYPKYIGTPEEGKTGVEKPVTTYVNLQSDKIDNLKYMGPIDPITTGGFYNSFRYKNFVITALLKFSYGNVLRLPANIAATYSDMRSMTKDVLNRWLMPGDEKKTTVPALMDGVSQQQIVDNNGGDVDAVYPYNLYNYSDERVVSGDYIKLSSLTLSYSLPKALYSRWGLTQASFTVAANNIWTLYADKRLNGQDPEFMASGGVALPQPKQVTLSLKIGL